MTTKWYGNNKGVQHLILEEALLAVDTYVKSRHLPMEVGRYSHFPMGKRRACSFLQNATCCNSYIQKKGQVRVGLLQEGLRTINREKILVWELPFIFI